MARPQSKSVYLYQPKLSTQWWVRFTLPPDVARHFKPPPGARIKPDRGNRVAYSLHTTSKTKAEEDARAIESQLALAWKGALNYRSFSLLTGSQGKQVCTLDQFFVEVAAREQQRVKLWGELTSPVDRHNKQALDPHVAKRYELHRRYLREALAALYPGQAFLVHHFGLDADSRPHLLQVREWILQTRRLEARTYKQLRAYFSAAWTQVAIRSGYCDTNPWHDDAMAPPDQVDKQWFILAADQRAKIFALGSSWKNNALKLLLLTGMRPSDLCWLMRTSFSAEDNSWTVMQPKTARPKLVPNTPDVAAVIADQVKVLNKLGLAGCNWLWPRYAKGKSGVPSDRHQMVKVLGRALHDTLGRTDAIGRPIQLYALRRTFASLAGRRARQDPHNIATLMGHRDLGQQMTYSQIDHEALLESATAIQKKIKGA